MSSVILFFIIIVIFVCMSLVLNRIYSMRIKVYKDIKFLITIFIQEIGFKKISFNECLFNNKDKISAYSYKVIFSYLDLGARYHIFNKEDFLEIYNYIDSVSLGDVEYAISLNKYHLSLIDNKLNEYISLYKSNGVLYIKLIIIFGVLLAVIVL